MCFDFDFFFPQRMLINDTTDPNKYAGVRVTRSGYREMVKKASKAKNKSSKLLNEALQFLFTKQELANSSGMGLRKDNVNVNHVLATYG